MEAALTLSSEVGIKPACEALEVSRTGFYRTQTQRNASLVEPRKRPSPPRALSSDERQGVIDLNCGKTSIRPLDDRANRKVNGLLSLSPVSQSLLLRST